MYKHLVVAVDGSETSLNALKHAAELASVNNARLTLVHVANPAEYMALAPEFLQHESYEAAAVAQGNEVLDFAGKNRPRKRRGKHCQTPAGSQQRRARNGAGFGRLRR